MFCLLFLTVPHGFHIPYYIFHLYQLPSLEDECAIHQPPVRVTFSVLSSLVAQLVVSAYSSSLMRCYKLDLAFGLSFL